jgi:hypothetical protein
MQRLTVSQRFVVAGIDGCLGCALRLHDVPDTIVKYLLSHKTLLELL